MTIIEHSWNWSGFPAKRKTTDAIVLHHAAVATATVEQIDAMHKANGWSGIGYHFYVRKNGEVHRGRPESTVGAHVTGHNSHTIGVCAEGNYETETAMPAAQQAALRVLVAELRARYPGAAVKRHSDYMATACPGRHYPFKEILEEVSDMTEAQTRKIVQEEIEKMVANTGALPAGHWGAASWAEAKTRGITDGTRPLAHITRLEAATMILNAIKKIAGVK